ncbi:MAG TPA: hypothetical protein VGC81_14330, partial [Candidatus Methylomirabilis sp.]
MAVTEDRLVHRSRHSITLLAAGLLLWGARVEAQALPKIEGPLTMEQAVVLSLEHSRKVKAS